MDRRKKILNSLLSGILFIPAWYSWGSGVVLFVAFIPLLLVEYQLIRTKSRSSEWFWLPFLTFFIWNLGTTWWIKNASFAGLLVAIAVNTFMMTLPFWLFTITHRKLGDRVGYLSLIIYWLAMEFFYLNAEISWTWLNLGNGFAQNIRLIQWYEYTGTLGGTLWVLAVNIALFKIFKSNRYGIKLNNFNLRLSLALALILLPIAISLIIYQTYREKEDPYDIVIVQPNIDPYYKFNDIPVDQQLNIFFRITDSLADKNTDYIVAPETFINDNIWLNQLELNRSIRKLITFQEKYPGSKLIIGITAYRLYDSSDESPTARPYREDKYFDSFNTAIQIDSTGTIQDYFKSQLVVGVEKMPYTRYLGFLRKLMLHLGGTFRSHGSQDFRESFSSPQDSIKVAPVICYESIFGEYVTDYIRDADANFIFVITNDGWWGDTPGYIQHNSYSSLRAIETRRSVARSANTGISAFFNQKGKMILSLGWWERDGIRMELNANDKLTFYTKYGDYLGRIAAFLCIALLLYTLVTALIPKK